jgi:anti-sigma B factor antagonist
VQELPPPPDDRFDVAISGDEDCVVVAVRGDIDIYTASPFRRALDDARSLRPRTVVVDLAGVGFMDSTGFGQLVSLIVGDDPPVVTAANCRPIVRNAFRLMGLDRVLRLHAYGDPPLWPGVTDTSRGDEASG